jgi:hypothetical protein
VLEQPDAVLTPVEDIGDQGAAGYDEEADYHDDNGYTAWQPPTAVGHASGCRGSMHARSSPGDTRSIASPGSAIRGIGDQFRGGAVSHREVVTAGQCLPARSNQSQTVS